VFSSDCATNLCRDGKCYACKNDTLNNVYDCTYADTEVEIDSAECTVDMRCVYTYGLSGGALAGIIIGSIVGVIIIAVLVIFCMKKSSDYSGPY
jgi:hypothetical protein